MYFCDFFDRFNLDYDGVFHEQVESITLFKANSSILNGYSKLPFNF